MKRLCKKLAFPVTMFLCFIISGCHNDRPQGMPKLTRCELIITKEGQPAENIAVRMVPLDKGLEKWPSAGTTDASGKARIVTYGKFAGVPVGKYKIVLNHTTHEGGENDSETTPLHKREAICTYSLVHEKYTKEDTTPLELTVDNKAVSQTFEIGPEVKVLIEKYIPGKSM